MSLDEDIKKLCNLSKLEIPDSDIEITTNKIKEIILFFDKIDKFSSKEQDSEEYDKLEKTMDELREDISHSDANDVRKNFIHFKFLHEKNGFVVGPRI